MPDGLELVRIGQPMRPEFAAWRYGDQFGKRRVRNATIAGLGIAATATFFPGGAVSGGSRRQVQDAVRAIEQARHPHRYLHDVARRNTLAPEGITALPATVRLALERVTHEETERRALEGELAQLEQAWRDAEEIAAISDSLLVPAPVRQAFEKLRGH